MRILPMSGMPTARRCRELADESSDSCLLILAKHLDLPLHDAETLDFLRTALRETDKELHVNELQWRIDRVKGK